MEKIILEARPRTEMGKKNTALRAVGDVPAVVYGHGSTPIPLVLEAKILERVYAQNGGGKIINLKVAGGKTLNVLIHDVQYNGITGRIQHADFYTVRMDELVKTEVALHFVGESTAIYQDEGTLVKNLEALEIECLPGDLPEAIEVDISVLDDFEKTITIADLVIPEGVKLLMEDSDEVLVAKIDPPRSDAEMAELDDELTEQLPEGVQEEQPVVVSEENEGDKDRRDKK
jgi:large subunit ribosomal protein L25